MHILLEKGLSFSLVYIFPWKVYFFLSAKAQMVNGKNIKTCLAKTKQNKTKKKNWRQLIKTITNEFKCFDVRPQHCNFSSFYNKNSKSCTVLFLLISCLKYIITNSHMLYYFDINTCIVYCFRRKQHSYAACDAALAASIIYICQLYFDLLTVGLHQAI